MSAKWTSEQQSAIQSRGQNLLLSAAAGSGKTAVLVERIIRLITEDRFHIHELLVLTFTRAAAGEMKNRIGAALAEQLERCRDRELSAHLERQLSLLGSAQISTIDSFCQFVMHQYFYRLDLDPNAQILSDENQLYLMADDVLSEVLLSWYKKNDPAFQDCADLFSERYQDRKLREEILKIYRFSRSLPFPEDWLSRLSAPYDLKPGASLDSLPWVSSLLSELRAQAAGWAEEYRSILGIVEREPAFTPYAEALSEEYALFSTLSETGSWDSWYCQMQTFAFPKLKAAKKKDASFPELLEQNKNQVQDVRNTIKEELKKFQSAFFSVPPETWAADMARTYPIADVLAKVTADFAKAFQARKCQEGVMDFSDLSHYALSLLLAPESTPERPIPSESARELQQRYKEVMIDEYQDTNDVQELITCLISGDLNGWYRRCGTQPPIDGSHSVPRFMVGDIKQSIYRFRMADPGNFTEKYKSFSQDEEARDRRIDLNRNFRSDTAVLEGTNFIFRRIMTEDISGFAYGDAEALRPGRGTDSAPKSWVGGSVDIALLDTAKAEDAETDALASSPEENDEDIKGTELEGRFLARRISDMLAAGLKVQDKDGSFRPLRPSDIVILLRSLTGQAPALLKAFREEGLPAVSDQDGDFLRSMEVQQLWALLKILDNPRQDLALTAALRFFAGLGENDLVHLRQLDRNSLWDALSKAPDHLPPEAARQCADFLSRYASWRQLSRRDSVSALVRRLLDDTDLLTYVSGLPGGVFRRANLIAFYNKARAFDEGSMSGLYRFLAYLQKVDTSGRSLITAASGSMGGAVRIMSIHKSKGLEFPVVFIGTSQKKFNTQDMTDPVILHKEMGLGLYCFRRNQFARWPTLYWQSVKAAVRRENRAEEQRLLYVAMTRARDKLIITGRVKGFAGLALSWVRAAANANGAALTPARIAGASSYLDWIMPAAAQHPSMRSLWDKVEQLPCHSAAEKETPLFSFSVTPADSLPPPSHIAPTQSACPDEGISVPVPEWMERQLSWSYGYPGAVNTPAKLTATAAVRMEEEALEPETPPSELIEEEADAVAQSRRMPLPEETTSLFPDYELAGASGSPLPSDFDKPPAFLANDAELEHSGAAYGTLMHKAMEVLDFPLLAGDDRQIREEIVRLAEEGVFTPEERDLLFTHRHRSSPADDLLRFRRSSLGTRMALAKHIRKELSFSLLVNAQDYYPSCEPGETIFLQGIMDCLFEEEDGLVIIDYKTDYVPTGAALSERYRRQLLIYKEAAERIFQKPVKDLYLWSFHLGEAVPVI